MRIIQGRGSKIKAIKSRPSKKGWLQEKIARLVISETLCGASCRSSTRLPAIRMAPKKGDKFRKRDCVWLSAFLPSTLGPGEMPFSDNLAGNCRLYVRPSRLKLNEQMSEVDEIDHLSTGDAFSRSSGFILNLWSKIRKTCVFKYFL